MTQVQTEIETSTVGREVVRHALVHGVAFHHPKLGHRRVDYRAVPRRDGGGGITVVQPPKIGPLRPQAHLVALAERPHHQPRTSRLPIDAPQQSRVVRENLHDSTAAMRQHACEGIHHRERCKLVIVQISRLVTNGAHGSLDYPSMFGHGDTQLVHGPTVGFGGGKAARLLEGTQPLGDAFRVFLLLNELGRNVGSIRARARLRACQFGAKSTPAFGVDDRVEVLPQELPAEVVWQGDITVRKGVNQKERVDPAGHEAPQIIGTGSERLDELAGGIVHPGRHCKTRKRW
jgi:hypothetical protein